MERHFKDFDLTDLINEVVDLYFAGVSLRRALFQIKEKLGML